MNTQGYRRRRGFFFLDFEVINNLPKEVMKIMGSMIILKAYKNHDKQRIEYIAMSPLFDETDPEDITYPEYHMLVVGDQAIAKKL